MLSPGIYPIENIADGTHTKAMTARKNIASGSNRKSCFGRKLSI
jgi:hypothetical protein